MNDQRFPLHVRLIGVMHKDADKMFMTSVLWSDQSEIIVYRSFQEFKKLHKRLKRRFPPKNPFRKSDRVLPRFPAKTTKSKFQKKGPGKSMLRLKNIAKYCTELFRCDRSITQSDEVMQFFLPQNQDLDAEYAKNSIVILPSDDYSENPDGLSRYMGNKRHSVGNISQPFITATYRCVAPYETKDTKNRPFSITVNETVDVLIKDKAGWWLVENAEKRLAWFPAPYLESCEDDGEEDEDDQNECPLEGKLYCATRCYRSTKEDELSVNIGSVVEVLQKSDDGWWLVRYNGKAGYVPSMYLRPYSNPHIRFQALKKDMCSSTLSLAQLHLQEAATHLTTPQGDYLMPTHQRRFCSMEVLASCPIRPITEEPVAPKDCKSSLTVASSDTELILSDENSSLGSDYRSDNHSDVEEQEAGSLSTTASISSDPAEEGTAGSTHDAPYIPKVPPRPRVQEILTRCTTITRKAAQTYKANLTIEHRER